MPDKKLTDNEIVKALKEILELMCCEGDLQRASTISNAIDLINRQNAEISVKKKLLDKAEAKFEAFEMDKKQLESDIINANQNFDHIKELWEVEKGKVEKAKQKVIDIGRALKTAKSEARKEFAERINREIIEAIISNDKAIAERERKHNVNRYEDNFCAMCDGKVVALSGIKSFIDNLLKEMERDNNA